MVRQFYIQMSSIPQDAYAHIVTVRDVQFEILQDAITQLLGLPCVSNASITQPIKAKWIHNIGTSASSNDPVDSHAEEDHSEGDDQSRDIHYDENFFVLTRKYCTQFDTNNTLSQKSLLSFFFCMLHLIISTNLDLVAYKATFSGTVCSLSFDQHMERSSTCHYIYLIGSITRPILYQHIIHYME